MSVLNFHLSVNAGHFILKTFSNFILLGHFICKVLQIFVSLITLSPLVLDFLLQFGNEGVQLCDFAVFVF